MIEPMMKASGPGGSGGGDIGGNSGGGEEGCDMWLGL